MEDFRNDFLRGPTRKALELNNMAKFPCHINFKKELIEGTGEISGEKKQGDDGEKLTS
jgi:hypothetical protein